MIITLYKNCRLNKSYCEVLDTIAPHTYNGVEYANSLEAYLSTLPKKVFNTGTGTIYGTNSGKIPFELAQGEGLTMYDYNYMKIADETNNFVRYCFILSLQVANGSAIAEYEEDVWASYSATMHIRKSLLTRSRSLKYGNYNIPFYKLGMEYEGNNDLDFVNITENSHKVNIIAQVQFFQLTQSGEQSNIITRTAVITDANSPSYMMTIDQSLTEYLTTIKNYQSSRKFIFDNNYKTNNNIQNGDWYYEINDIILVPEMLGLKIMANTGNTFMGYVDGFGSPTGIEIYFVDLYRSTISYNTNPYKFTDNPLIQINEFEISANFECLGIGFVTEFYTIEQNGTDIKCNIFIECDDFNVNIFIFIQNQIINITNNLYIEVPISSQTADVTQQQKTARELEKLNYGLQIAHGGLQLYQGGLQLGTSGALTALGAMTGQVGMLSGGINGIGSSFGTLFSGVSNLAKGIKQLQVLNKPLFKTNKGTFSKSIGVLNAFHGLCLVYIIPDNTTEVQANIDNGGYVVNEVVDDLLQDMAVANDKPAYNVMQFDYINNYGSFPEDIRQRLVDILTNGFKIWYNTAEYIAS